MSECPRCETKGRPIGRVTLEAQVVPGRLGTIEERDGWRSCRSEACEVVYFRGAEVVVLGETAAVPTCKGSDPARLVCFCFGHSVADLEADVRAHGRSEIQASIKAACRAGLDDCARKNPQGRCCLGNVAAVIEGVAPSSTDEARDDGCCAPSGD